MDIHLGTTHIYALNPALDFATAQQQATDKRLSVVAGGLGGLLSRPKPEEVDLTYWESRYEAFWHLVCTVRYIFERKKDFSVAVAGNEVRKVTLLGQEFEVAAPAPAQGAGGFLQQLGVGGAARSFTLPGVEYCVDENKQERFLDAGTGQVLPTGAEYVKKDKSEVVDLSVLTSSDHIIVPPQQSASKIAKALLATMAKQIQADKILEDTVEINILDLYFRPVYAFEFTWKTKNKTGIAEFDAATGNMIAGKVARGKADKPITKEELFDINNDTVTSLVPTTAGNVKLVMGA
jgi:hypothetical protein